MKKEYDSESIKPLVVLLLNWRKRAIRASLAHYHSSSFYGHCGNFFTCFNIVCAIAVLFLSNNKLFANIPELGAEHSTDFDKGDLFLAIFSLLVVLTTSLQYVLKFEVKSRDAKNAGNDFTGIKREIELLLSDSDLSMERAKTIQISHTHASRNHALVLGRSWRVAEEKTNLAVIVDREFETFVYNKFGIAIPISHLYCDR